MGDPPPAKKPRVSPSEIHLTEAEQKVVKIQFEKNNRSPKTPPWNALLEEYCRFLQIKLSDPSAPFAPSYIIDQMWHAHILSTRDYLAFCERHNDGVYVHHDPTMTRGQPRYDETLQAYQKIFKEKPGHPDIWPQHVGQKPKGRVAAVKKEEDTDSNESDHAGQEQSRRAVASVKKEEEIESDEDYRPNQKPRAVVKKEEEEGADSADQEPRAAVAVKREQDTERTDNEDRKPTDAIIKKEEEREWESGENDRARVANVVPNVAASANSARSQNARRDEEEDVDEDDDDDDEEEDDEEEDEGPADYASYDTDEREYLELYGNERGETLEELQEWHREAILDPVNNEGFDPRVCLTTYNCIDGHRWYDGEFLLDCDSCRESSAGLGGFSCG